MNPKTSWTRNNYYLSYKTPASASVKIIRVPTKETCNKTNFTETKRSNSRSKKVTTSCRK